MNKKNKRKKEKGNAEAERNIHGQGRIAPASKDKHSQYTKRYFFLFRLFWEYANGSERWRFANVYLCFIIYLYFMIYVSL